MPRPDPARNERALYPHHDVVQVRFQDLDMLGHINNVAMAALFETARVRFNSAIGLVRPRGWRWLVVNVELNYLAEGRLEDVEVGSGVARIGTRSWMIAAAAFQRGGCIATCDVTLVARERDGDSAALPEAARDTLERWMLVQS